VETSNIHIQMTSAPEWTVSLPEMKDRRGTTGQEITPEGKKWECCAACNGLGKVLVDDIPEVKRYVCCSREFLCEGFVFCVRVVGKGC